MLEIQGVEVRSRAFGTICTAVFVLAFWLSHVSAQDLPNDILRLSPETEFNGYTWIAGSWTELIDAQASAFEYHAEGYEPFIIPASVDGVMRYRVAFGRFQTREDAVRNRPQIPPDIPVDAWIAEVRSSNPRRSIERVELSPVTAAVPETSGARFIWNDQIIGQVVEVGPTDPPEPKTSTVDVSRRSFVDRYVRERARVDLGFVSQYDSNIDHVKEAVGTFGYTPALFLRYEMGGRIPILVINYFGARHNYTDVDGKNRWSHYFNATALPDQRGNLRYETAFQVSRTVLSDERQLSDDVQVRHRFEYRFSSTYRVRLYGTVRWERYVDDPDQNVFRPNIGFTFRQRMDNGSNWDTEVRWEKNVADSDRDQYRRLTLLMDYRIPVSNADELVFEVMHRRRMYDHREVDVEDETVLRQDLRWSLRTSWARNLTSDLRLLTGYHFERRDSNDPAKIFEGHVVDMGLVYRL